MSDSIEVRNERAGDGAAITAVNDSAFGQPDESRIIDAVRQAGHAAISLVAADGGMLVGHILFTPVTIDAAGPAFHALGLGPMAVLPEFQRKGIGTMLVEAGLAEATRLGCPAVVVIGHPEFYPRFGFRPARAYGLLSQFEVPGEAFMVRELVPAALAGCGGVVRYVAEFGAGSP